MLNEPVMTDGECNNMPSRDKKNNENYAQGILEIVRKLEGDKHLANSYSVFFFRLFQLGMSSPLFGTICVAQVAQVDKRAGTKVLASWHKSTCFLVQKYLLPDTKVLQASIQTLNRLAVEFSRLHQ